MNDIYTHFISRDRSEDQIRVGYILWFVETFPEVEFKGEDLVMYKYCSYCSSLEVPMRSDYFNVFMLTELKRILVSTHVNIPGTDNLNYDEPTGLETAYVVAKGYLENAFKRLESLDSDVLDFRVHAQSYMRERLSERMVEELGRTFETLTSTNDVNITANEALDTFVLLNEIYTEDALEELGDGSLENTEFEFVCDTGISVIDDDIGGIYTCQCGGIEAQPGVGKTRMALGVWAYRAAVLYHKNVIYYQLEQSKSEAIAMLVARHVFTLYGIQVSDSMILRDKVPEELQSKVKAAKIDLFESGKYGKIYINHTDLYHNTLTQTLKKDDKLHGPFDMIIIDYMGLIEQQLTKYAKPLLDYQVIAVSFRKLKRYVERSRKCAIAVSQFNTKGVDAGKADKEITPDMAQGGMTVYRNTDWNLAVSRTETMKAQQKVRISQPKVRLTAGFGSVVIDTRLGMSYFYLSTQQKL